MCVVQFLSKENKCRCLESIFPGSSISITGVRRRENFPRRAGILFRMPPSEWHMSVLTYTYEKKKKKSNYGI